MKLRKLNIGYKKSAPIVSAIDADLRLGEFVCLVGRNGTGKSTLLRTLAELQAPLSGEISFDLHPTKIFPSKTHPNAVPKAGDQGSVRCAIVLTQMPELQNTTVRQMVAWGRLEQTGWFGKLKDDDYRCADRAIATMKIGELSDRNFPALSDGEKQKTMIARALAQGSDYLLLDEPSAFLDYPSKVELMQTLRELAHRKGKAILLSSHDLDLVNRFADKVWEIANGRLTESTLRLNKSNGQLTESTVGIDML